MPKRHGELYQKLLSFESLHAAWLKAQKGKRYKRAVLLFEQSLEHNLTGMLSELENNNYKTGGYHRFYVHEPKKREIARLENFRDRVLQHAVFDILTNLYEPVFISDSFACRKNKGTHAGANRAQQMMRAVKREHGNVYALKCDVSKYFENVDHAILRRLLNKKIKDQRFILLIDNILKSFALSKGMPLGNVTSQIFANIYLNELDQHIKRDLREKHYIRYMDDFVIFSNDKNHLHDLRKHVAQWLWEELRLTLNNKTAVFPVDSKKGRPLDFLGYRLLPNSRQLRRNAITKMRQKVDRLHWQYANHLIDFDQVKKGMASHIAHANHADSHAILLSILNKPFKRAA